MHLNIYYNEEILKDEDNYDEAYLSFKKPKENYLVNDTLPNIIKLIIKLLNEK